MTIEKIKAKAKSIGVKPGKLKKEDLIRKIQITEGNFPCFQTAAGNCDQQNCTWRNDCLS